MKALHIFLDVNMCCQHGGLYEIALKKKINIDALPSESTVLFFNKAKTKCKAYSSNGVLAYIRRDGNKMLTLESLNAFTYAVRTGIEFELSKNVHATLLSLLNPKPTTRTIIVRKGNQNEQPANRF